jgi:hypothetical protein
MSLHTYKERDTELAHEAYTAVAAVPTLEPNDRNRLGYHVWLYLRGELPSLEDAVKMARTRYVPRDLAIESVVNMIETALPLQSAD